MAATRANTATLGVVRQVLHRRWYQVAPTALQTRKKPCPLRSPQSSLDQRLSQRLSQRRYSSEVDALRSSSTHPHRTMKARANFHHLYSAPQVNTHGTKGVMAKLHDKEEHAAHVWDHLAGSVQISGGLKDIAYARAQSDEFNLFDKNLDGTLSPSELRQMTAEAGVAMTGAEAIEAVLEVSGGADTIDLATFRRHQGDRHHPGAAARAAGAAEAGAPSRRSIDAELPLFDQVIKKYMAAFATTR